MKALPALYEIMANEAMFGIATFDAQGQCIYLNRMGENLLSATAPILKDLVPESAQSHIKAFSLELLKHDGLYQDIMVKSQSGANFIANLGVRNIVIEGEAATVIMIQDITLQKKLQREIMAKQTEINAAFEELLKQNRQLKELDHAKDRFIALTTHELRTPLSAVFASAEILKLKLYDTPEQMEEFIHIIYDQGQHLQDLVNDILDFAKIQAGKMDFYIEKHDPVVFIQGIVRNFEAMAEASEVTLNFQVQAPDTLSCYYDTLRLRQIASNMINNAIKYNVKGGSVTIAFEETADCVRILVTDTGPGISADQFDKVFNEFETVGNVSKHHKGTGLGMPISRKLVEGMGGKLLLKSEVGIGSTFWVELPKEKVCDPELYRPRPESGSGDLAA